MEGPSDITVFIVPATAKPSYTASRGDVVGPLPRNPDPGKDKTECPCRARKPRCVAVVGGREYSVGGWSRYEVERRRSRWEAAPEEGGPGRMYPGRTYVGGADVVSSVGASSRATNALRRAASRFSVALGKMEEVLCDPSGDGIWECLPPGTAFPPGQEPQYGLHLTVPVVTSDDARAFSDDVQSLLDVNAITELVEDASSVIAGLGGVLDLLPGTAASQPARPLRFVGVGDSEGVLKLEASTVPFLESLEEVQSAAATRLEEATKTIETALAEHRLGGVLGRT